MIICNQKMFLFLFLFANINFAIGVPKPISEVKISKHPVVLVVSFDGFRHDYMEKAQTPNLRALQEEGVKVPYMQAQFPTKTFPNHQSIVTGLYPDYHGITDNTVFDPLHNRVISGFNDDPEFWNYHPEALPFYIRNEQAGDERFSGCFLWPGSTRGYGENGNLYPTYTLLNYDESIPWETRVETAISWITNELKPANMVFMYFNEPDTHGHEWGTDDENTLSEIEKVDKNVGYLVNQLKSRGLYDIINLVIVSDHGMQTVRQEDIFDTSKIMNNTLFDKYGGSPVVQIKPRNPSDLEMIYNSFKNASEGKNFTVYKKEEMEHLHFTSNRRIMELILLGDLGFGFEDVYFNDEGLHGLHGYNNNYENMRALFIARGPLFKSGFDYGKPVNNLDLVPLFSKLANVTEPPNNGSVLEISEILKESFSYSDNLLIV